MSRADFDDHGNLRSWQPAEPVRRTAGGIPRFKPEPEQPKAEIGTPTPGEWFVRTLVRDGEIVDAFVAAPDCTGLPYGAEIMGDDEYTRDDDLSRKLADCHAISATLNFMAAARACLDTELGDMACLGSDAPAENALGMLKAALAKAEGKPA